jgi:FkbM family methyltransferase
MLPRRRWDGDLAGKYWQQASIPGRREYLPPTGFLAKKTFVAVCESFSGRDKIRARCNPFSRWPPAVIVDAGANVGQTALRYHQHWKAARIYSFEPVRATFLQLSASCAGISAIECLNIALGAKSEAGQIHKFPDSQLSTLAEQPAHSTGEDHSVEAIVIRRLDEFAAERSIDCVDLLKIDVEGYELQVLLGASGLLSSAKIRAVYAECSLGAKPSAHVGMTEIDRMLVQYGFRFSGLYEAFRWGPQKRFFGFANGLWLRAD